MGENRGTAAGASPRQADAHKGSNGRVLVIAGSREMPGAAALAVEAAYRGGCGYVLAACPGAAVPALVAAVPGAILRPCGAADRRQFQVEDADLLLAAAAEADAVVLGPGWGPGAGAGWLPDWLDAAQEALPALRFVVDADALNRLAEAADGLAACGPNCVVTPHPGEAARLLGLADAAAVQANRPAALRALCAHSEAVVLLKGAGTLVARRGGSPWQDTSAGPELATAGTGDVLAGLLGALLARGIELETAAQAAVGIHAAAGARAATRRGHESVLAQDLVEELGPPLDAWLAGPAGGTAC